MALTILNNIAAIAAENQLNITSNSLNSTLEQLSSGSRINSGADDPAGLAIANGLQANIAALTQSASNATDGVGELQVADGALSQVTTLLNRAVTLATESATGTVSDSQRQALDAEYQSIKAEIDSIGSTTNFNGGQVFTNNTLNVFLSDGSTSGSSTIGVSTGLLSSTSLTLGGTPATATLGEAVASNAAAATDVLTGGTFVGSTQAASLLTASTQFNALASASATLTGGAFTQGAAATGTITSNGTAPSDGDQVTVGGTTYTFKTTLTASTTANQVLIGASATTALGNLVNAINDNTADTNGTGGGATTDFGTLTTANASVTAADTTPGTLITLTAKVNGSAVITTAVPTGTTLSFGGGDLANGVAGATVTLGTQTYTFVHALSSTATANEVLFGANEQAALGNLQDAVNHTTVNGGGVGVTYSTGTLINSSVTAGTATATTLGFTAKTAGTAGNAIAVGTSSQGSFANAAGGATVTLANGTAASTVTIGNQAYTFVSAAQLGSAGAYSVLINSTASGTAAQILGSLTNLADAVNGVTADAGTNFSTAAANTFATAGTATAGSGNTSTLAFTAQVNGVGNGITGATGTGNTTQSLTSGTTNGFAATAFQNGTTGDSLTVGGQTYNFVSALSTNSGGTPNEVVVGASVATDLTNLEAAVNNGPSGSGSGTGYSVGTATNTAVHVTSVTPTTATFGALSTGTAGNNISTAISGGIGAFATTNFTGGSALVSVGGPAVAGDTVTVGTQRYTFVNAITNITPAYSVLVGAGTGAASETASLTNLAAAINGATGSGVTYGLGTAANTSATAALVSNPITGPVNQILFTATTGGATGNTIVSTSTGGDNTFTGTLFTGGGTSTNDLLSSADATAALTQINDAVATVAALRGDIGATVNRLNSASAVINNQTQNLTSAENDVTAADIPTAVANLSQYSILEQTGISALAQANQQSQLVLKLLQ